jgi:hypothetical protein
VGGFVRKEVMLSVGGESVNVAHGEPSGITQASMRTCPGPEGTNVTSAPPFSSVIAVSVLRAPFPAMMV